jgi:hypothetical protein
MDGQSDNLREPWSEPVAAGLAPLEELETDEVPDSMVSDFSSLTTPWKADGDTNRSHGPEPSPTCLWTPEHADPQRYEVTHGETKQNGPASARIRS